MMQRNPAQKLTDGVFRGFWIREGAHFHPVGQSPGGEKRRTERGGGRKRVVRCQKQEVRGETEKNIGHDRENRKYLKINKTFVR